MTERKPTLAPTPSWRRLTAGALATFLAILAVLGARVAAGADPALDAASAKKATTPKPSAATSTTQDSTTATRTSAPADSNPPTTQAS